MHPTFGTFFVTFDYGEDSLGSSEVQEKFAEVGQAELFLARITWGIWERCERRKSIE